MHRKDGTLARQYVTADAKRKTLAISSVYRLSDVESVTHRKDGILTRHTSLLITLAISSVYRLSDIESATHRKDGTLTQQYVTVDAIKVTFTISRC